MWQTHYLLHRMRMDELLAEADRERRWRLHDRENGRQSRRPVPGPAHKALARALASLSRSAARVARRLDERVVVDLRPDRLLRDA
jgi:hypothetical protein